MTLIVDYIRRKEKVSTIAGQRPTIPPSNDHTDGTWNATDIYVGELFINLPDSLVWTRTDTDRIIQLNVGDEFISGLEVTNGTSSLSFDVDLGVYLSVGEYIVHPQQFDEITIAVGDITNPRLDLFIVDETGTAQVILGTPQAIPVMPSTNAGDVVIGGVLVPANHSGANPNLPIIGRDLFYKTSSKVCPEWNTQTFYDIGQIVIHSTNIYRCIVAHNSTVFATNLSTDWQVVGGGGGGEWQDSVLSIENDNTTIAPIPTAGDRYLVGTAGVNAFAGHSNEIAEWNGGAFIFTEPTDGMSIKVDNVDDTIYHYEGTYPTGSWVGVPLTLILEIGTSNITNGTIGGVLYEGALNKLQQSAPNFFWDDTWLALNIGTQTSKGKLTVVGDGSSGGIAISDTTFSVSNSLGFETLKIQNDGQIYLATNSNSRIRSSTNGGGRMVGGAGDTATTPAFGFFSTNGVDDGGGGNGWYRPASANVQCWATGGVERMRLTSGGSLGLGTAVINAKMHVKSPFNVTGTTNFLAQNSSSLNLLKLDNGGWFFADTRGAVFGDGSTVEQCASLEVKSTNGGILFPRMDTIQRNGITLPTDGLIIWNSTTVQFEKYDTGAWSALGGGVFTFDGQNNLYGGTGAGGSITTITNSIFAGRNAGASASGGNWSVLIGTRAGANYTDPIGAVAIGENSLRDAVTCMYTTAVGFQSAMQVTGVSKQVTAIGHSALESHANVDKVVAIGDGVNKQGLGVCETSVLIGSDTGLNANPSGSVIIGSDAYNGVLNTNGNEEVIIGCQAGLTVAGGSNNIAIGFRAEPKSPATNNQLSIGNAILGTLDPITPFSSEIEIAGKLKINSQVYPADMYDINWTLQSNLAQNIGYDGDNGNSFIVGIGQAGALTIDDLANAKAGATYTLVLYNPLGATLNNNPALHGADVKFPNGVVPSLTLGTGFNVIEVLAIRDTGSTAVYTLITNCTYFS